MDRKFRNESAALGRSNSKKDTKASNSAAGSTRPAALKAPPTLQNQDPLILKPAREVGKAKRPLDRPPLVQEAPKDVDADHDSLSDTSFYESAPEYQTDEEIEPANTTRPRSAVRFASSDKSYSPAFEKDPRRWSSDSESESEDEFGEDDLDETLTSSRVDQYTPALASARSKSILKNNPQQPLRSFQLNHPPLQRSYSSSSDSIKSVSSFKRSRHREDGPLRRADGSRTMRNSMRRTDTSQAETSSKPTRMSSLRGHQEEPKPHKLSRTASLLNKLKHPRGGKHRSSVSVDTGVERTSSMLTPPPTPSRFTELFSSEEDTAPAPVQTEVKMPTTLRNGPSTQHNHNAPQKHTLAGAPEESLTKTEPQAPQTRLRSQSNPALNEVHMLKTLRGNSQKDTQGQKSSTPIRRSQSMVHKLNPLHRHHQAPSNDLQFSNSAAGVHLPSTLRDQPPQERKPTQQSSTRQPALQPARQSARQPAHQSAYQPANQPAQQPGSYPLDPTPTPSPTQASPAQHPSPLPPQQPGAYPLDPNPTPSPTQASPALHPSPHPPQQPGSYPLDPTSSPAPRPPLQSYPSNSKKPRSALEPIHPDSLNTSHQPHPPTHPPLPPPPAPHPVPNPSRPIPPHQDTLDLAKKKATSTALISTTKDTEREKTAEFSNARKTSEIVYHEGKKGLGGGVDFRGVVGEEGRERRRRGVWGKLMG